MTTTTTARPSPRRQSKLGRPYPTHTKLGRALYTNRMYVWDLSKAIDIHPRLVTSMLAGTRRPTIPQLYRMCQFFGCHPDDLVEDFYPYCAEDHALHGEDSTSVFNDDFLADPTASPADKALLTGDDPCT